MSAATLTETAYSRVYDLCSPVVTHYRDDLLKHDHASITANPDMPFIIWARECGTHLLMFHSSDSFPAAGVRVKYLFGDADREHMLNGVLSVAEHCERDNETRRVVYCDGTRVRTITKAQATKHIREYCALIRRQWRLAVFA